MIVIGLTGSIGMGKTTLARQFALLGVKICNADTIVHRLMAKGGAAVREIEQAFSGVVKQGAVDRRALGEIVFNDKQKLAILEHILHPLVVAEENRFIEKEQRKGAKMVVMDIPLLFETDAEDRCDLVVVATAPGFVQRRRVMARPHMTEEKFRRILDTQMPDREKRNCADIVISTGLGKAYSFRKVAELMHKLRECGT